MTPIELVLSKLSDAKRCGRSWIAPCPAHDDRTPSLSVSEGENGHVLLHCHAGCAIEAIVAALGLAMCDVMPDNGTAKARRRERTPKLYPTANDAIAALERKYGARSATWVYSDTDGEPTGFVLRWDRSDGRKIIRPVSRHGTEWAISGMPAPRVLYRLSELGNAKRVYVCEGEKAADAVRSVGLVASTSPHGARSANKADWGPLGGKEVVIFPDNDDAGRQYADEVAAILFKLKAPPTVKIVELPDLPPGGDAVEYVEARRAAGLDDEAIRAEIDALVGAAVVMEKNVKRVNRGVRRARLVRMSDVPPRPLEWLWPGRIPLGKLTLIAGDPGLGKTFVTIDMSARVSRGTPWPDCTDVANPVGDTVLLSAEDDIEDTIRPRLDAAGADVTRILALQGVEFCPEGRDTNVQAAFNLEHDLPALEEAIESAKNCRLVIIDPISAFCGRTDSDNNTEVRGMLAPLAELAGRHRVAIVVVTHLRKSGGAALYRAMGSLAFIAAARASLAVVRDKENPERRLLLPVKNNLAKDNDGLAFTLEQKPGEMVPVVRWSADPVSMDVDEALRDGRGSDRSPATDEAADFLRAELADGPVPAATVKDHARKAGISERTLNRAKKALNVVSYRIGYGAAGEWYWALPPDASKGATASDTNSVATFGLAPRKTRFQGTLEPVKTRLPLKDCHTAKDRGPTATFAPTHQNRPHRNGRFSIYDDRRMWQPTGNAETA